MKRKRFFIGSAAIVLSIACSLTPSGVGSQPARATEPAAELTDLNNLDQLKQAFQRDRGTVRLIALLSPV